MVEVELLSSTLLAFFFLITVLLAVKWWFSPVSATKRRLPPSPPKLPLIGNFHQLGTYPHRTLQTMARQYGPLMLLHLGQAPALIVSSAHVAQEVMKTHDIMFCDRPKTAIGDRLLYEGKDVALAPYGEYWRQIRSICVLQLLSNKRVQSFRSVREEEVTLVLEKVHGMGSGVPIDLSDLFQSTTINIICQVALGKKYGEDEGGRKFKRLLEDLVGLLGGFNIGDFIPSLAWLNRVNGVGDKVSRVSKEFDEFLEGVIEEHVKEGMRNITTSSFVDHKDFVDVLLEVQKDGSTGFPLSRTSIKAIVLDVFAGGSDTTYTVLEWAMTELLRHPNAMKKLQNEVREVSQGRAKIIREDLHQMPYLKAVLKETLRLYPPIPLLLPRVAIQDVKLDGYDVAAGTTVMANAWAIGRDPASWAQPDEFIPERFLGSSVDYKGQDFELIPFGSGRRGCPGIVFAMATNELLLASLVNRFDWALPEGVKVEDVDMTESTGVTIHRKVHLLAVATPTSSSLSQYS